MVKKNVLVAGSGNVTGINVIKGLLMSSEKIEINVYGCDCNEVNPANKFCENFFIPRCSEVGYIDQVAKIIKSKSINYIIPTNDHDLRELMRNNDLLNSLNVKLNCNSKFVFDCLDKGETLRLFEEFNIKTPSVVSDKFDFPYVVRKKVMGTNKKFTCILKSKDNLDELNNINFDDAIFTRYIEGQEFTIDVLCNDVSDLIVAIPRKRLIVKDGMVTFAVIENDENIIEQVRLIANKFKLNGISCIQCIKNAENELFFIEINPRPGSGIDLSINSNVNLPILWIENDIFGYVDVKEPLWGNKLIRYSEGYFFK